MAEASGDATSGSVKAEIYISTALRINLGKLKFLAVSSLVDLVVLTKNCIEETTISFI